MGALKNFCHDELEAKRYAEEEFPEFGSLFGRFATAVSEHLCASDRAKGEHFVIAAAMLPVVAEEIERWTDHGNLDARLLRVEQSVFPGDFTPRRSADAQ